MLVVDSTLICAYYVNTVPMTIFLAEFIASIFVITEMIFRAILNTHCCSMGTTAVRHISEILFNIVYQSHILSLIYLFLDIVFSLFFESKLIPTISIHTRVKIQSNQCLVMRFRSF